MDPNLKKPLSFDEQALLKRLGGDRELMIEILTVFIKDAYVRIKMIVKAAGENDLDTLKKNAHSFKGAAGNVDAVKLHYLLKDLEASALEGNRDAIDKNILRIREEMTVFTKTVDKFL